MTKQQHVCAGLNHVNSTLIHCCRTPPAGIGETKPSKKPSCSLALVGPLPHTDDATASRHFLELGVAARRRVRRLEAVRRQYSRPLELWRCADMMLHLGEEGGYDVAYDDGDHESNVAAALVREEVVTKRSLDDVIGIIC